MTSNSRSAIEHLDRATCEAILKRHRVGRLAFTFHDRVDIEPINYVFATDWIYLRTSDGTKLHTLQHHPWTAFEVDEASGLHDWRSVVVHGTFRQFDALGIPTEREHYERALVALRTVSETILTGLDVFPERKMVCGIAITEMQGRAVSSLKM
ncbi:MAG: pyridoxamine 5'-phosphate oxidase family protein [Gemmatimonadaceae bacterium]